MQIIHYTEIKEDFYKKMDFDNAVSVSQIISDIRENGDIALREYSKKFGDGDISKFRLSEEDIENAISKVNTETIDTIKFAIKNVKEFAQVQLSSVKEVKANIHGNILGQRIIPLDSVGCYIPGGNYPLPSSAIMTIVPAKVAGVKRIAAVSPRIQPVTVAAAVLSGADEIYRIGGVQAIAALAYGTESIKKVNKITGPGNKYVTAAKKVVYGECGIDFLAGPSEVLIIADKSAKAEYVAADILAQCEHDKDARGFLICFDEQFAKDVNYHSQKFLEQLSTKNIAEISYDKSIAIVVDSLEQAIEIANNKAPEHLELCIKEAEKLLYRFTNYGSIFVGNNSAEVFGDYVSGTNHTLPTNQASKYTGGLSIFDYIKVQTYQIINDNSLNQTVKHASFLAEKEGLFAHKLAADIRRNQ